MLTTEQAIAELTRLNPNASPGGPFCCPVCDHAHERDPSLQVSPNGNGPHYACSTPHRSADCTETTIAISLETSARSPTPTPSPAPAPDAKQMFLAELTERFGLSVTQIMKRGAQLDIVLGDERRIELGTAGALLNNRNRLRGTILEQANHLIPKLDADTHPRLVGGMVTHAEHWEVASTTDETIGWLADYIGSKRGPPVDLSQTDDVRKIVLEGRGEPFFTVDGRLGLVLKALRTYVARRENIHVTVPELSGRLAGLGFTKPAHGGQLSVWVKDEQRSRNARYWISPPQFEERL